MQCSNMEIWISCVEEVHIKNAKENKIGIRKEGWQLIMLGFPKIIKSLIMSSSMTNGTRASNGLVTTNLRMYP